jgi:hypothetical protein
VIIGALLMAAHFPHNAQPLSPPLSITWVMHADRASLQKSWAQITASDAHQIEASKVAAFSQIRAGRCIIHFVDQRVAFEPEHLGHELAHCIYGAWHPPLGVTP